MPFVLIYNLICNREVSPLTGAVSYGPRVEGGQTIDGKSPLGMRLVFPKATLPPNKSLDSPRQANLDNPACNLLPSLFLGVYHDAPKISPLWLVSYCVVINGFVVRDRK
jgi:hypothetical protein